MSMNKYFNTIYTDNAVVWHGIKFLLNQHHLFYVKQSMQIASIDSIESFPSRFHSVSGRTA